MVIFLKAYVFLINTENIWSIVRRTITYKFIYMTSRYRYCVLYQNKQPVLRTTLNYIHVINKQIKLLIPRKTNKRYFKQLIHIYLWNWWYIHKSSSKYILKIVVIFSELRVILINIRVLLSLKTIHHFMERENPLFPWVLHM